MVLCDMATKGLLSETLSLLPPISVIFAETPCLAASPWGAVSEPPPFPLLKNPYVRRAHMGRDLLYSFFASPIYVAMYGMFNGTL